MNNIVAQASYTGSHVVAVSATLVVFTVLAILTVICFRFYLVKIKERESQLLSLKVMVKNILEGKCRVPFDDYGVIKSWVNRFNYTREELGESLLNILGYAVMIQRELMVAQQARITSYLATTNGMVDTEKFLILKGMFSEYYVLERDYNLHNQKWLRANNLDPSVFHRWDVPKKVVPQAAT